MKFFFKLVCILFSMTLVLSCGQIVDNDSQLREVVTHRSLGLAYLEEGELTAAAGEFQQLIDIVPKEALGYANLGLTYLRMGEFEQAEVQVQQALKRDKNNPDIRAILALIYEMSNQQQQAIEVLERILEQSPKHVMSLYNLVQFYAKSGENTDLEQAKQYLQTIAEIHPGNIAARLQLVEVLVQLRQQDAGITHLEYIRQLIPEIPENAQQVMVRALSQIRSGDMQQAFPSVRIFHNLLKSSDFYQAAILQMKGPGGPLTGSPIVYFSKDYEFDGQHRQVLIDAITFEDVTNNLNLGNMQNNRSAEFATAVFALADYDNDGDVDIYLSRFEDGQPENEIYLLVNENGQFQNKIAGSGLRHPGQDLDAIFADYDNDGYQDLYLVNDESNILYRNNSGNEFANVSIPAGGRDTADGNSALFGDYDLDGDLDLFVANPGRNSLYRNNLDGTFTELAIKMGVAGTDEQSRDVAFGDFDDDGDLDLLVTNDESSPQLYSNLRQSYFEDISASAKLTDTGASYTTVTAGDYNNDGFLDLFLTGDDGESHALLENDQSGGFLHANNQDTLFAALKGNSGTDAKFFDFNNDGYLDLLFAGEQLLLFANNGQGVYQQVTGIFPETLSQIRQVETADYDGDGDEDVFLTDAGGKLRLLRNDGGNVNNYLNVQLVGLRTGSGKNNYFGIGASVEVKAGTLYQKRIMTDPTAHFGLGNRTQADVVRVVWSNGVPQNRLKPESNQTIAEQQILKGSCPWLYAWNGEEFEFVTDVLWPSALGMPVGIMGDGAEYAYSFPHSTNEYLRIPGKALEEKDGKYIIQFTDELWETPYVDKLQLIAVDHPDSVDVYIDERFTLPPYEKPKIHTVVDRIFPVVATDDSGNDVLSALRQIDEQYVSGFATADFQGITETHELILDPGRIEADQPAKLFLHGWVFPTDASINVAMAQSDEHQSQAPSLSLINQAGDWQTVIPNLGFPKGKNKMVIVDLTGKFLSDDHRVRIETNMQIYWNQAFFTVGENSASVAETVINPATADLHYRGFSDVSRATPYSPHIPDYSRVSTEQKWRDLTGFYTRYGDVQPLLTASDNKYVIMNAGDEMTVEFDASGLPELQHGWTRDFLFYNDGWLKDGDLNTALGYKVNPLPFHGMSSYPYPEDEEYPREQTYNEFLETYNTREVTGREFQHVLKHFTENE